MTEEDEIDVLGDFNFDIFSKEESSSSCLPSEILQCDDYDSMGSNWILGNPNQSCWLSSSPQTESNKSNVEVVNDSWEEQDFAKEKSHIDKGSQLFSRNNLRILPVKDNIKQLPIQTSNFGDSNSNIFTEYFDETQIPASIEEVITAVKTGEPTISSIHKRNKNDNRNSKQRKVNGTERRKVKKSENDIKLKKKLLKTHILSNKLVQIGGEVIRIVKDPHFDSDEHIDVDNDDDDEFMKKNEKISKQSKNSIVKNIATKHDELKIDENEKELIPPHHILTSQDIFDKIYEISPPNKEVVLNPNEISKEEKAIHYDFFDGGLAKTPLRYLKIRNHIIDRWKHDKPKYLSKTSARSGLKNCGDVNCIGRIHTYLEQIGAINFNCAQVKYTKAVFKIRSSNVIKNANQIQEKRTKKRIIENFSSDYLNNAGGYTIKHEENGDLKIISPKLIHKPKKQSQERIRLITCENFEDFQAPFHVRLHLDALIIMDFHSHLCHSEVIGLLGGFFDEEENVLHLTKAQPCKSKSTQIHCEMCPVSQSEANIQLQAAGLEVVGWYHSHPTFFPNPSLQDLSTQSEMQQYFHGAPFVSMILSPYSSENTLASIFRCLIVKDSNGTSSFDTWIPYRFNVELTGKAINLEALFDQLDKIFNESSTNTNQVILQNNFHSSITYYQKCLTSISEHMNNADSLTSFNREKILTNLKHILHKK